MDKKVLILTYYWPPSGGSGVQRWLKFVKYLPEYGVKPFVFTPENPSFSIQDASLLKNVPDEAEVIHFPIWEPYELFSKLSNAVDNNKPSEPTPLVPAKQPSLFQKVSTWIRGNFFIPDPRLFWVRPSVNFLKGFLEDNNIDTIITTGPPHSVHLIGLRLKKNKPSLRWIADFRDPWSDWGLLDSLKVGRVARRIHKSYESKVLSTADDIVTITPFYARRFEILSNRKVHLLTNGFDEDDFKNIQISKSEKFIIRHVGIVNEKCDPRPFMQALKTVLLQDAVFYKAARVEFLGEVHPDFKRYVSNDEVLHTVTVFAGNIQHKQLLDTYGSSALLLLILTGYKDGEGFLPGKLFEYMATGLPVLGIGPKGDASEVLQQSGAGKMIDSNDHDSIVSTLKKQFQIWQQSDVAIKASDEIYKYSRKEITKQLSLLLRQR